MEGLNTVLHFHFQLLLKWPSLLPDNVIFFRQNQAILFHLMLSV